MTHDFDRSDFCTRCGSALNDVRDNLAPAECPGRVRSADQFDYIRRRVRELKAADDLVGLAPRGPKEGDSFRNGRGQLIVFYKGRWMPCAEMMQLLGLRSPAFDPPAKRLWYTGP